jgi:hypothetical protein
LRDGVANADLADAIDASAAFVEDGLGLADGRRVFGVELVERVGGLEADCRAGLH